MNSPCFEQARLSREATAAQKTREATEAPSSRPSFQSQQIIFRVWTPREATAAQKKLEQAIAA